MSDIQVPRYALSAVTYVRREDKLLLLKRAMGEATGAWYIPGGFAEEGETAEEAARRELFEEAGLEPTGPMTLLAVEGPTELYGIPSLGVSFACDCAEGDVKLSAEHEGFRWVDPREYRAKYFDDALIDSFVGEDERLKRIISGVRDGLDRYIAWLDG